MIRRICSKKTCTGCGACVASCPLHCIRLVPDREGFLYPYINESRCIKCQQCLNRCPVLHPYCARLPLKVYAAQAFASLQVKGYSSGGMFPLLAEQILKEDGVVFGAAFNKNWEVIHRGIESITELEKLVGSKYVQSSSVSVLPQIRDQLSKGRKVLFTGTPCQVSGLLHFLNTPYDNLYTISVICHGVPSPAVWNSYLEELTEKRKTQIAAITFRDKRLGWHNYGLCIHWNNGNHLFHSNAEDNFLQGFISNLYLRPSCSNCQAKSLACGSDLTLGDFWNIADVNPRWEEENTGISLVLINTPKGRKIFENLSAEYLPSDYQTALRGNPSIEKSAIPHRRRKKFFRLFGKRKLSTLIEEMLKPAWYMHIHALIRSIIRNHYTDKRYL